MRRRRRAAWRCGRRRRRQQRDRLNVLGIGGQSAARDQRGHKRGAAARAREALVRRPTAGVGARRPLIRGGLHQLVKPGLRRHLELLPGQRRRAAARAALKLLLLVRRCRCMWRALVRRRRALLLDVCAEAVPPLAALRLPAVIGTRLGLGRDRFLLLLGPQDVLLGWRRLLPRLPHALVLLPPRAPLALQSFLGLQLRGGAQLRLPLLILPPAPLRLILELAQPLRLGYGAGPRGRDHGRHSSDHALVRPRSVQTVVSPLQAAATSKPGAPRSRRAPVLRDRGHVHAAAAARCWRTDRPALRSLAMPPLSGLPRHC
mmetsp:Transcript_3744/g.10562  ORF Transcript_3744/g.10562 Transcript_3744/m.10562 type:complete len:317 (-) Transcript_3744:187-1137(-)